MAELAIIDTTGDTKVIWDANNADEVEAARATFEKLTKKGYKAFSVKDNGKEKDLIKSFDASLEKIILVPPIVGG